MCFQCGVEVAGLSTNKQHTLLRALARSCIARSQLSRAEDLGIPFRFRLEVVKSKGESSNVEGFRA